MNMVVLLNDTCFFFLTLYPHNNEPQLSKLNTFALWLETNVHIFKSGRQQPYYIRI